MNFTSHDINNILGSPIDDKLLKNSKISELYIDSRKINNGPSSIFVALTGNKTDGHLFVSDAYGRGVRNFIVEKKPVEPLDDANIYLVTDAVYALQEVAKIHREKYNPEVIAITGSNGKTTVKEWLAQCLSEKYNVIKSPGSYNSQIGVALSLLMIKPEHEIAIIEAGISKANEMDRLETLIQPKIGVMTNLGDAHQGGFQNEVRKLEEKAKLFKNCKQLVWPSELELPQNINKQTEIIERFKQEEVSELLPERVKGHIHLENLLTTITVINLFEFTRPEIKQCISTLPQIPMRMNIRDGINGCMIIDDSYTFDLQALQLAIHQLFEHKNYKKKTIILSDFDEQNVSVDQYNNLSSQLNQLDLHKLILVGEDLLKKLSLDDNIKIDSYIDIKDFIQRSILSGFQDEAILIKGARRFSLERISRILTARKNNTVIEINLEALRNNIAFYRKSIDPSCGLMAVVKASAYGTGSKQLINIYEQEPIDCIAVAILDEAIEMRKLGLKKPILVFNPPTDFELIEQNDIEIELSNFSYLKSLIHYKKHHSNFSPKIHLKLDTGMHRLGFMESELDELLHLIKESGLKVHALFSHLVAGEESDHDSFTKNQLQVFDLMYDKICNYLVVKPKRHILNTGGSLRFSEYQYDYVRLGLGMYGIDPSGHFQTELEKVHSFKSRVIQIKEVPKGSTIGYGNDFTIQENKKIAIVGIGYADGLPRILSNGKFSFAFGPERLPIIGNVCMDLTMVDISHVPEIEEGDELVVFDHEHSIENMAKAAETIPYEILTRVAPRVKRLYIQ